MKRLTFVLAAALVGFGSTSAAAYSGQAATTLCVGGKAGCYSTIQAAVDAAHDGDTIRIDRGTFAGGVTIDVSVNIVGAGASKTTIRGGGPVLTIGVQFDPDPPTVSIRGVTITGGDVDSTNEDTFAALGGGVFIQIGADFGPGATVTITDSVITGNRAAPRELTPDGTFALAQGAGIDSFGDLTLVNTAVTNNVSGSTANSPSLATSARAGGIYNHIQAKLTIQRSVIRANHVKATSPHGTETIAGGIESLGELLISDSLINDNTVELESAFPSDVEQASFAGGIHIDLCPVEFCGPPHQATISRSIVHGNSVSARNVNGDSVAGAFGGGIQAEGPLALDHSSIDHNVVSANSAGDALADGGGLDVGVGPATIRDSVIASNRVVAVGGRGAIAQGGGIANGGQLTVQRSLVVDNNASARGGAAVNQFGFASVAQGGGIWNGQFGEAAPQLMLSDTAILRNTLSASAGFPLQGGGLFTAFPITRTRTLIATNRPDQCFGC